MDIVVISKIGDEGALGFMIKEVDFEKSFDKLMEQLTLRVKEDYNELKSKGSGNTEGDVIRNGPDSVRTEDSEPSNIISADFGKGVPTKI